MHETSLSSDLLHKARLIRESRFFVDPTGDGTNYEKQTLFLVLAGEKPIGEASSGHWVSMADGRQTVADDPESIGGFLVSLGLAYHLSSFDGHATDALVALNESLLVRYQEADAAQDYQAALEVRLAELRKEARQHLADQRRRRWEEARAAAIEQVIENHRASVLRDQIERWELAGRIDRFLEAAQGKEGFEPTWLRWIHAYREQIDPLAATLFMPTTPAITNDDLAAFMKGLDPGNPNAKPRTR